MSTRKPARGKTHLSGLGWRHQQQVRELKRLHIEGTPCWWCGEPMFLAQGLHGDHSTPRAVGGPHQLADRLLHGGGCNEERGDGSRDHLRPALTGRPLKREAVDLGRRLMAWPI